MNTINDLIDFLHSKQPYPVRQYIVEQIVRSPDNNKGHFWELCLQKAMPHAVLLGGNTKGYDFLPCKSDAKIATVYKTSGGALEASIGIKNKIGTLRVCLVVPGQYHHKVHFLLIPYSAYKNYQEGSGSLKLHLNVRGAVSGEFSKFVCKWADVIKPLDICN